MTGHQQPPTTVPVLARDASDPVASPTRAGIVDTARILVDTARILGAVLVPTLAKGVIKRRPRLMRLAERLRLDRRAIDTMRRMRASYGEQPLLLSLPGRSIELPLLATDAGRILAATPDPFARATVEKRAALRHFQPHGVLVSHGATRAERRTFTEAVLEPLRPMHDLAPAFVTATGQEAAALVASLGHAAHGVLGWVAFNRTWWTAVRRIVLGDHAHDDTDLTDLLASLRLAGNWPTCTPGNAVTGTGSCAGSPTTCTTRHPEVSPP